MKLSVVMPVYNEERTLEAIVAKVLAAPFEKELILVCAKLGESLTEEEAAAMVGEALIGYEGKIYYDGLLKILITQ